MVETLLQPSMTLLVVMVLGALFMLFGRGWAKFGRVVVYLSVLAFVVLGVSPVSRWLVIVLEDRFPAPPFAYEGPPPQGIIVLGGAIDARVSRGRQLVALNERAERFTVSAGLARRFPNAKLIVSNGGNHLIDRSDPYGYAEYRLYGQLGIGKSRIIYEHPSGDTFENAVHALAVAKPKPGETWLLVTSAIHMPRAMGSFRRVGFEVVPWPVDYLTAGWSDARIRFRRPSGGLAFADRAAKEWLGLAWYWLNGHIDELLPGPEKE